METVLLAENLYKTYSNKEEVLKGIDLKIEKGSFTVILGQSGSGKSTLLNVLSGMLKPTSGKVLCNGIDISYLPENKLADFKRSFISNIFQNYMLLNNLTVRENILIGISNSKESIGFDHLTRTLQIESILDKFPSQLSGGQQQRAAIARAVIKRPEILFCDEATGALDEVNSKNVVELLHKLNKEYGITILFVTHNLQIAETADRIITITDGQIKRDERNANPIHANDMVWG